jgi:hypothetical protein
VTQKRRPRRVACALLSPLRRHSAALAQPSDRSPPSLSQFASRSTIKAGLSPKEEGLAIAHHARIAAVVVATAVVAIFGAGAAMGGRATGTAAVCKTFATSGLKARWSVIGNVTCAKAKPWLVKLLADRGRPGVKVVLKNGPTGFKCSAVDDAKGRPAVGSCYTGTIAFPKNGFQWLA